MLVRVETAGWREVWTWWRRGRIELPVQAEDALSLLQAYPDSLISLRRPLRARPDEASQMVLGAPHRRQERSTPANRRSSPTGRGAAGSERHCLGSEGELWFAVYLLATGLRREMTVLRLQLRSAAPCRALSSP